MKKEYQAENCFNLVAECIAQYFTPNSKNRETNKDKLRFADSKLVGLFSDCTEDLNDIKLSKLIKSRIL